MLFFLSLVLVATPVCAQTWREYAYPEDGFSIDFPAAPTVEAGVFRLSDGTTVPARIYSLSHEDGSYTVTIADFSGTTLGERAVITQALQTLREKGTVKVDLPHESDDVFGRQLSIGGPDGSHTAIALFYRVGRLYLIEGTALAAAAQRGASEAIRFQQSLRLLRR